MSSSTSPPPLVPAGPTPAASRDCPEGFDNLLLLELAWRRHHNRPLCLSSQADEAFVRLARHLESSCPVCARWYQNAQRALIGLDQEARRPVVRLPRPSAVLAADAGARPEFLLELPAGPTGSQGLNALPFVLEWWSVSGTPEPSWYVTLRCRSIAGGPDVRPFAGRRVRMAYRLTGETLPRKMYTRLDLDQFGHLVSPPELLPVGDPTRLVRVKLKAARRPAAGPDCS